MLSDITVEGIGYAFVVTGVFTSVAVYIATIAYGVNRLEKSMADLQAVVAKHSRKPTSKPKTKVKGAKNARTKR